MSEEINKLIDEAKEAISKGEKEKGRSLLIKAVRLATELQNGANYLEKLKYTVLINELNRMIKNLDSGNDENE